MVLGVVGSGKSTLANMLLLKDEQNEIKNRFPMGFEESVKTVEV